MTKLRQSILTASLVSFWACGSPEQATIDQFFRAAQANDSATVAYMSAVGPPMEVEAWSVVEVSSRSSEPFTLPELTEKFVVVEKERNEAQDNRQKFATDNKEALEQIIPKLRDDPEFKFRGKLGAIQEEWTKLLDDRQEKERAFLELRQVVNRESGIASKSVMRQVDLGKFRGDIEVTEVLLNLKPKGGAELPFKATLRKYAVAEGDSDRIEPSRWVIVDIEGATEEARAAADAAKARGPATARSADAAEASTVVAAQAAPGTAARAEPTHVPRELRGVARVQILTPKAEVVGDEVVSTIQARNASKDWIVRFTVTEHWYDQQGNVVGTSSQTHARRFLPGQVVELKLRTRKGSNFFQNQFVFSHANGEVKATVVDSFPSDS